MIRRRYCLLYGELYMKKRKYLVLFFCSIILVFISFRITSINDDNKSLMSSWVGEYYYEEFIPPNIGIGYLITVYEENGLYAYINGDGFQTRERLMAKVWTHENELLFEFYDYYIDKEGNDSMSLTYTKNDILLKFKKENDLLITEWGKLRPVMNENEQPGQYFIKKSK